MLSQANYQLYQPHIKLQYCIHQSPSPPSHSTSKISKGHWSQTQKQMYHLFLQLWHKQFQNKKLRRIDKIFKLMSRFIGTRQADQCRSHHQKMQKKHKYFYNILATQREHFYKSLSSVQVTQFLYSQNLDLQKNIDIISGDQIKNNISTKKEETILFKREYL